MNKIGLSAFLQLPSLSEKQQADWPYLKKKVKNGAKILFSKIRLRAAPWHFGHFASMCEKSLKNIDCRL